MIVLDENIPEDQRQLLRGWRVRARLIGDDVGRKGMKDEQIIPLLLKLPSPTFFTRDFDFWQQSLCHREYCLVVLDLSPSEVATFVRRVLRHTLLNSKTKRLGRVVKVSQLGIEIMTAHDSPEFHAW